MKELKLLGALIGGAVLGVGVSFPLMMAYVFIYGGVYSVLPWLAPDPSAKGILPFLLVLYAIWFAILMLFVRKAGEFRAIHLFWVVLPWPSIVILHMWSSSSVI
ncbi:hypothetical protein [Bradyrhizobium viridifuturi]|uniref:hypothetical protein n=1 Tax=Bradyrhizobium viridifuturi TaxID=1654716 RepID=UPI00067F3129|nr:hypothetical protein [Bradyrhizobium viridifuturi]